MTPRAGINAELYRGLCSDPPDCVRACQPGSVAAATPEKDYVLCLPDVAQLASRFLGATTDSVRLFRASCLSRELLRINDLDEIEELRIQLQLSELMRRIPYGRQTDHTAHTLYLYLLGTYLFVNCPIISEAIGKQLKGTPAVHGFLFRWMYASLLHDIGYVFQAANVEELRAVNRMYRTAGIYLQLRGWGVDEDQIRPIMKAYRELSWQPAYEKSADPETTLDCLREIPWGEKVGLKPDAFHTMRTRMETQAHGVDALEQFAYEVAASGYDGMSGGVVDHAVASGLLLLQYCSLWYWFAHQVDDKKRFQEYKDDTYLKNHIVPACYAAAAHNMIGSHAERLRPAPIGLEDNPILYLGILADELQRWDRFPAGEQLLRRLEDYEKRCASSESIEMKVVGDRVCFRFPQAVATDICVALDKRLADWRKLVDVQGS